MGCKDLKGPAAIYDIGTCADIVAIKGPGLGHILIIIPYRNITELVQLANNFGHPEQVFIYGDAFSDTVRIAQSLNVRVYAYNLTISMPCNYMFCNFLKEINLSMRI